MIYFIWKIEIKVSENKSDSQEQNFVVFNFQLSQAYLIAEE